MRKGDCYCCLGVACDVLNVPFVGGRGHAPLALVKELGLKNASGESVEGLAPSLIDLNDVEGLSFNQIANHLETGAYFVKPVDSGVKIR